MGQNKCFILKPEPGIHTKVEPTRNFEFDPVLGKTFSIRFRVFANPESYSASAARRGGGPFLQKGIRHGKKLTTHYHLAPNLVLVTTGLLPLPHVHVIMEWNLINNKYNFVFFTLLNRNNE